MTQTFPCKEELLRLIRVKDETGAEALYDQYAAVLRLAIFHIVKERMLTENVLEKTFCAIWDNAALFKEHEQPLLTWMLAVAKKLAKASIPVSAALVSA